LLWGKGGAGRDLVFGRISIRLGLASIRAGTQVLGEVEEQGVFWVFWDHSADAGFQFIPY